MRHYSQGLTRSHSPRKWSLCSGLPGRAICEFLKQVLPTGEKRYGKIDRPHGWIITADGMYGYAFTLHKWI
jgi:hypothetical protein